MRVGECERVHCGIIASLDVISQELSGVESTPILEQEGAACRSKYEVSSNEPSRLRRIAKVCIQKPGLLDGNAFCGSVTHYQRPKFHHGKSLEQLCQYLCIF